MQQTFGFIVSVTSKPRHNYLRRRDIQPDNLHHMCHRYRVNFLGHNSKNSVEVSHECYSQCVWLMACHALSLIPVKQYSQHPKKNKTQLETRKQAGRCWEIKSSKEREIGLIGKKVGRKKKRCSEEEID